MTSESLAEKFYNNGFLVLEGFFSEQEAKSLKSHALELLENFDPVKESKTRFSTGVKNPHIGDEYFLNSGDKIRFFFEEDALDKDGNLVVEKTKSINKIGHGLHIKDAVFKTFTEKPELKELAKQLGFKKPYCLQSMVICKQPKIGGSVPPHQDSTFLYTNPPSAVGFWFALEDCTIENGCMWFSPGSHKSKFDLIIDVPIHKRFVRLPQGGTGFVDIEPFDKSNIEKSEYACTPCKAGTLVLIHGGVLHKSGNNASEKSRFIYTFHMIEGDYNYPSNNWLQPTQENPFHSFYE